MAECTTPRGYLKDLKGPIFQFIQSEGRMDLCDTHGSFNILLICKDDQDGVLQFLLLQHGDELLLADANSVPVCAVHHVDDGVRVGVVTPPVRSNAGLTCK